MCEVNLSGFTNVKGRKDLLEEEIFITLLTLGILVFRLKSQNEKFNLPSRNLRVTIFLILLLSRYISNITREGFGHLNFTILSQGNLLKA